MNVDIFEHGVPNGEDFRGEVVEESKFFSTFYRSSDNPLELLIQARKFNGKQHFYYSYLVYKNVLESNGRSGSYFGITLRLDEYCKDFANIYRILDTAFHANVVGRILSKQGESFKYLAPRFSEVEASFQSLEQTILQMMQNTLDGSFTQLAVVDATSGSYPKRNLHDCIQSDVQDAVRLYGRIGISPYYQSMKEAEIKHQCETRLNAMNQKLIEANARTSNLEEQIRAKNDVITRLNNELSRLKVELKNAGNNKRVEQLVQSIQKPITELAGIMRNMNPTESTNFNFSNTSKQPPSPHPHPNPNYKTIGVIVAVIFVVVTLFCVFAEACNKSKSTDEVAKIEATRQGNSSIQSVNTTQDSPPIAYHNSHDTHSEDDSQNNQYNNPFSTSSNVQLEISGYKKGEHLRYGESYQLTVINGVDHGQIRGEGCDVNRSDDPNVAQITPFNHDQITISYYIDNKLVTKESFDVQ